MNFSELAKIRVQNQGLSDSKIATIPSLFNHLGAMQAQEFNQSKWSIGQRLPHLVDLDIENAFNAGILLRTHLLRPTWHFVSAEDIQWMTSLSLPGVNKANAFMHRKLELNDSLFSQCNTIMIKTLEGGKHLTRDEINLEFAKNQISVSGFRLSYIMMQAELIGLICSGAKKGANHTYALLNERVPISKTYQADEALEELTKRYFLSRGPASIYDFATWSGLTLTECKKGIAMQTLPLLKIQIEDLDYFHFDASASIPSQSNSMLLLSMYDEVVMGYKDRTAFFDYRNRLGLKEYGSFNCFVLQNGQVLGTWKRTFSKKSFDLQFEFYSPLTADQRSELDKSIHQFEVFHNLKANKVLLK